MTRLRSQHQRTFSYQFRNLYDNDAVCFFSAVAVVFALLAFGIMALVYSQYTTDFNAAAAERQAIVRTFHQSPLTPADVTANKVQAMKILSSDNEGLSTIVGDAGTNTAWVNKVEQQLQATSHTGKPPVIDYQRRYWNEWRNLWVPFWGEIVALVASVLFTLFYLSVTTDEDYYLADVPWRRVWPFFCALVTPLGIPFYIVSAFRLRAGRRRVAEDAAYEQQRIAERNARAAAVPEIRIQRNEQPVTKTFTSDRKRAHQVYRTIRTISWREFAIAGLREAKSELTQAEQDLAYHGTQIREAQARRAEFKAKVNEFQLADVDGQEEETKALLYADAEFDRLTKLAGVTDVGVKGNNLVILLEARYTYRGVVYDFGDWELSFGVGTGLLVNQLRSGARASWTGGYPVYGHGSYFCFGARAQIIQDYIMKGQFLEAVDIAVESMTTPNDNHKKDVPSAFKEVATSAV